MKILFKSRIIILVFIFGLYCFQKGAFSEYAGPEIKVYLAETKSIPAENPARIAIANPEIADVSYVSKDSITVSPKSVGSTTLVFWDNYGEQSFQIKVLAEDISGVKRRLDSILSKIGFNNVYTDPQEEESKVLLLGSVKSDLDKERLLLALDPLKNKIIDLVEIKEEEAVVGINVQVLELNKDATNTLGFSWPGGVSNVTEAGSPGLTGVHSTALSTFFRVLNIRRDAFQWSLDALVQQGKARILSSPQLACQSGKEAQLLVGGEKPVLTTQASSSDSSTGSTSVEYKEYGIKLKIKPSVNDNRSRINIQLDVEVSEIGEAEVLGSSTSPTARAYPLTKRNASTELFVNDGQTIAIGGLVSQKEEDQIRKTPILGDLPIVGLLFRKKTTRTGGGHGSKGNIELFITLTPTVMKDKSVNALDFARKKIPAREGASSDVSKTSDMADYAGLVQKKLMDNFTYPTDLREKGYSGTVKLALHISYFGELLGVTVKESSGYDPLDQY
ncbi:MAG: pilus assembly protein N-terminal domain-containing protein, partial [Candidatus Omnitrophica bacterium]|nr:pilus assembly protein N-terminal domain-containing protein [Candidatus Omnitrophota bacterium]